jgi:hypothetical protein
MRSITSACTSDAVTCPKLSNVIADRHNDAGRAVSKGRRAVQFGLNGRICTSQPFGLNSLQNLFDEVGSFFGFSEQALFARING